MEIFNVTNPFGNSKQANILITKYFKVYIPQFFDNDPSPKLALPQDFSSYIFSKASVPLNGKDVFLPEVDKILTEYCNQCLQTYFTIEFIELVNQQSFSSNFPIKDEKLEYAVNLYILICKLPTGINEGAIRKTLSFYLGNPFGLNDLLNPNWQNNLINLKKSLEPIAKTYLDKLLQVNLPNPKTPVKLNNEWAQWFIARANSEMEIDLNYYFEKAKMRARLFSTDDIVNDPRFRASLADSRWNEYDETIKSEVAFYNQRLSGTSGFVPLDWRLVKAMLWTEVQAGPKGNPAQWQKYPLQIGRFAEDAGYLVVSKGLDNSDLIVSSELRQQIQNRIM